MNQIMNNKNRSRNKNKFQNKNEEVKSVKRKNSIHPSGIKAINLSESLEQQLAN